jgi:hypothetical protein
MVFLRKSFFGAKPSIFDVVKARATQDRYDNMVTLVDTAEEAVAFILSPPMVPEGKNVWSFESLYEVALIVGRARCSRDTSFS